MDNPITIPSRNELVQERKAQAQLHLREFDPHIYSTFYARIYDAEAYLEQVGIDKICELVEHGNGIIGIAKHLDISVRTLRAWLKKTPYYQQQVKEAYAFAGDAYAFKAERVLLEARYGSKEGIAIASKLAEHYRWMATKLDKEQYGEIKKEDANASKPPLVLNLNLGGAQEQEEVTAKHAPITAEFIKLTE